MIKVIDFWAEWCGPCKVFAPIFESAKDHYKENSSISFEKIDVDADPTSSQKHSVRGIPTVIIFKDDIEIARKTGLLTLPKFIEFIENNIH
jgi:thioredoxin